MFANSAVGGNGGDGFGRGIYNDERRELRLAKSLVFRNGPRGGEGIGGGRYDLGDADLIRSRIFANLASTDDDDSLPIGEDVWSFSRHALTAKPGRSKFPRRTSSGVPVGWRTGRP